MKKIISLLLVISMIVSLAPGAFAGVWAEDLFEDVGEEAWFYETVKTAYELELMSGYGDGSFRPKGDISLAETLVVAARIHNIHAGGTGYFEQGRPWYQVYVDYCLENGIIDSVPSDYGAAATRMEFAEILARSMPEEALKAINTVEDGAIPDVEESDAVYMLYRAGVLMGNDDKGSFLPEDSIARSEVAAVAVRMLEEEQRESITLVKDREESPVAPNPDDSIGVPEDPVPDVELFLDENNGITAPFDVVYPDLFASGELVYSGEHILIKLESSPTGKEQKALSDAGVTGLEFMMDLGAGVWYKAGVEGDVTGVMEKVRALDFVVIAEYDFAYEAESITDCEVVDLWDNVTGNEKVADQWYLRSCGINESWQYISTPHTVTSFGQETADETEVSNDGGEGVVVAVIDTGVDYTHTDLADNIWINRFEIPDDGIDNDGNGYVDDYYGYDAVAGKGSGMDDHGHGTHVAGIIGAANNNTGVVGIAYNAKIMPIKAGMASGYLNNSDIAEAIIYAANNGADVINMSFGGSAVTTAVQEALVYAYTNCVLVASAGNDGVPNEEHEDWTGDVVPNYPAAYAYVLGVMSVGESGAESSFTNWDAYGFNSIEYEVYAPGENMLSTIPGNSDNPNGRYASWDGTSMAAPVVAAAAALLRAEFSDPEMYPTKFIYGQISGTTEQSPLCVHKNVNHNMPGTVNIYNALTTQPTPDVAVQDYTVFDTVGLMGNERNNGDGIIDAGETIAIGFTLRNRWGKSENTVVTVDTLSSAGLSDPYITIHDGGSVNYGEVGTYSTQDAGKIVTDGVFSGWEKPIYITVAEDCPNDYIFRLNYTVTCENALNQEDETVYSSGDDYLLYVRRGVTLEGIIDADMTLTKDNYYIIQDSLYIPAGVTVTVEAGTQVQFWSSDEVDAYADEAIVDVKVDGVLRFEGTAEERIKLFPGERMAAYRVEIAQQNSGQVLMWYTDVVNPYLTIEYAEGCGFTQNYRNEAIWYRYLSGTTVWDTGSSGKISVKLVKNSSFELLGSYEVSGNYEGCVFADNAISFAGNAHFERCVFYGNNNYLGETSGGESSYSISSTDTLRNFSVVTDADTGTKYISFGGTMVEEEEFCAELGGYFLSVNSEEELEFLKNNGLSSFVTRVDYDAETGEYRWPDGTVVGDFIETEQCYKGNYSLYYDNVLKIDAIYKNLSYSITAHSFFFPKGVIEIPLQYPEEINVAEGEVFVELGGAYQINASAEPAHAVQNGLIYESMDEGVVTVDGNGLVTPVSIGRTDVYVYSEDRHVYNTVTVNVIEEVALESVELGENLCLEKGETMQLEPEFFPADSSKTEFIYSSSDESVATVSASGLVTAVGNGEATIKVESPSNMEAADEITVEVYTVVTGISVEETVFVLSNQQEHNVDEFGVTVSPADATDKSLVWESSNPEILKVDDAGALVVGEAGTAAIRATTADGGYSVEFTVGVAESVGNSAVKDIQTDHNQTQYVALLEDGTLWHWGEIHPVPVKLPFENVKSFAYTFGNRNRKIYVVDGSGVLNAYDYDIGGTPTLNNDVFGGSAMRNVKKVITNPAGNSRWALLENGTVYVWGNNQYGELATGNTDSCGTAVQSLISGAVDIVADYDNAFALLADGSVHVYGSGAISGMEIAENALSIRTDYGNGNRGCCIYFDDRVELWYGSSMSHSAALEGEQLVYTGDISVYTAEGRAYAYSYGNSYGQLGVGFTGSTNGKYYPVLNVENVCDVFAFKDNTFFATRNGELYSAGSNNYNRLGNLTAESYSAVPGKMVFGLPMNSDAPAAVGVNAVGAVLSEGGLVMDYDQAVRAGGSFATVSMTDSSGSVVALNRNLDLDKFRVSPVDGFVDGETYTLTIPAGALANIFGVESEEYSLAFTYKEPEQEFGLARDSYTACIECAETVSVFGPENAFGEISWVSDDAGILEVSDTGELVKHAAGTVTLTATDESGASDSVIVYIKSGIHKEPELVYTNLRSGVLQKAEMALRFGCEIEVLEDFGCVTLTNSAGEEVAFSGSVSGNEIIIVPEALSHEESYILTFETACIVNPCGFANEEDIVISFIYSDPGVHVTRVNDEASRFGYTVEEVTAAWEEFSDTGLNPYFQGNVILNRLADDDVTKWLRIKGGNSSSYNKISISGNYWGTTNEFLINQQIYDFEDYSSLIDLDPGEYLTEAPENVWPFVVNAGLIDSSGADVGTIGNEKVTFYVEFNRDMDTSIPLDVRFGSYYPYADYEVEGEYVSPRRWEGTTTLTTLIEAGYQFWSIDNARAADNHAMELCKDWGRFTFEIDTSSALAMVLQGTATDTGIELSWTQDDFDTLAGYNIYRADTDEAAYYQRLNSSIIPVGEEEWFDDTVEPGMVYYYIFTVVKTDLSESEPSGKKMIMSKDTMSPTMYHTPVYQAYEGTNVTVSATVTDNVSLQSVKLHYRVAGGEWKSVEMTSLNDKYSAIISKNYVTLDGIEYYISAYDGVSYSYKGSESEPYVIVVQADPGVQMLGDVDGDGSITVLDALKLLRAANNKTTLTTEEFERADINGDGLLHAAEALVILKYANGEIGTLTME